MDMSEIVPVEIIPALAWMGKQDWIQYHMHPTERRTEIDNILAYPPKNDSQVALGMRLIQNQLPQLDSVHVCLLYSVSKALAQGPKLLRVTLEQCLAMEHVDINLPFDEYEQPYPAVFIELPAEYRQELTRRFSQKCPRYLLVFHDPRTRYIFAHAVCGLPKEGETADQLTNVTNILPPRSCYQTVEQALTADCPDQGPDIDLAEVVERVGMNLCLMLTHAGVTDHGPSDPGRLKKLRRTAERGKGLKAENAQIRIATMPALISFRQEVKFFTLETRRESQIVGQERTAISPIKPHWRRGHYRHQRIGVGRTEMKLIFIAPVLVNRKYFSGDVKDTETSYRII